MSPSRGRITLLWILSIVLWAAPNLSTLLEELHQLPAYVMDGPYQVVASCRRVMEFGQIPGRDFVVFHGNGMVWLHLPVYFLLPKTPEGAFICYYAMGALVLLGGYSSFLLLSGVKRSLAVPLSCLGIGLGLLAPMPIRYLFMPMHNLVSTRVGVALFLIAVISRLLNGKSDRAPWKSFVPAGVVAGVGLALFRDVGMYVLVAQTVGYAITSMLADWKKTLRTLPIRGSLAILGVAAGWLMAHLIGSGGAIAEEARLSFQVLPQTQGWYWVDGAPMTGLYSLGAGGVVGFFRLPILAVAVSLVVLLTALRMRDRFEGLAIRLTPLFLFGLLGLIPETGYLSFHYIAPTIHAAIASTLLIAGLASERVWPLQCVPNRLTRAIEFSTPLVIGLLTLASVLAACFRREWYQDGLYPDVVTAATKGQGPALSDEAAPDRIPELITWLRQLGVDQGTLWSMHTGPADQAFAEKPTGAWDSIYFALGAEDEGRYLKAYHDAAPDWVLSVDSRYRPGRWQRQWFFMREVMASADPVASGAGWTVWKRNGGMRLPEVQPMARLEIRSRKDGFEIELPASVEGEPQLIELTLNYTVGFHGLDSLLAPSGKLIAQATDGVPNGVSLPCRSGAVNSIVLPILTSGGSGKLFSVTWKGWGGPPQLTDVQANATRVMNLPTGVLKGLLIH